MMHSCITQSVRMLQIGRSFALPQLPEELQEEFALVGMQLCNPTGKTRKCSVFEMLHNVSALSFNIESACLQMSFCCLKQTAH